MSLEPIDPPVSNQKPTLLSLPIEIRSAIYSHLPDGPLRLRAPCPFSKAPPMKQGLVSSPLALLSVCRQIREEAAPFIYRRVHFGWLANMTKALAHPSRKALYSRNIIEATSQYDIGLIEDCLRAATCLARLKRLTLLAEVSAIYAEEKHISTIFKSLRLYRDDLSSMSSPMPFQVDFRLTVVDFGAKSPNIRPSGASVHGERAEYSAEMVSILLLRADTY
jgi:hypothetical protein